MRARRNNQRDGSQACTVDDFWLETGSGSVGASWFWPTEEVEEEAAGVLIVPGLIHEEQTMALGLVALARECAAHGMPALLVDLAGTAQGSGTLGDPGIGQQWDDDVRSAVRHMRSAGLRHIAVVGVRVGALIAAHATTDDPVDLMVLWSPLLSGRRHVRELKMMQASATELTGEMLPGITVAGFNMPPSLVDTLSRLDAGDLDGKPASRLCVVDTEERLDALDVEHPLFASVRVDRMVAPETEAWLFTAADGYAAPFHDVARVRRNIEATLAAWPSPTVDAVAGQRPTRPDLSEHRSHVFLHDGVAIRETRVRFGEDLFGRKGSLSGVFSEPVADPSPGPAFVTVTSVGPGRIFVDLARQEAARGRSCLRFELSGFGTSSRRPGEPWADFYHPAAQADIGAAVEEVVRRGFESAHVVGFCAGAWSAVQMAPRPEVSHITGINAQLMVRSRLLHRREWPDLSPGQRRLLALSQHHLFARVVEKLEREHPVPSPAVRWVKQHVAAGTDVTFAYAEGDAGLEYYRRRARRPLGVGRRTQPDVRVHEELGHLPSGTARQRMLDEIHDIAG